MKELEKTWEDRVCNWARSLGVQVIKMNLQGNRGWPDRLFMYEGRALFLEFKRKGEKPGALQEHRLKWLVDNGFTAGWSDDEPTARETIRQWLKS